MAKDYVRSSLGFAIGDGDARITFTDAAPGVSGETAAVSEGTLALGSAGSLVAGKVYIKRTAGAGTDKWEELVDAQTLSQALSGLNVAFDPKDSVLLATDAALPANTRAGSGVGATLTMDAVGIVTVDGEDLTAANSIALGSRILVKDEVDQTKNGIYTVTVLSDAGTALELTRAVDFDGDPAGEVSKGAETFVESGTANINTSWRVIDPIGTAVVDTDNIVWGLGNRVGSLAAIQAEIDAIETSIGPIVASDGTWVGFAGTNHLDGAVNLDSSLRALDTEIGADVTANARANNPIVAGDSVNSNIEKLDDAIGLDAQLTPLARTIGAINLSQSLYTNLGNIDAFQGADADLTPVARTVGPVSLSASNLANVDSLDAALGGDPTAEARTFSPISAAQASNVNIDRVDAAIGADLTSTNIVSNAQSVNDNLSALDGEVFQNGQNISDIRFRVQTNGVTTAQTVGDFLVDDCRMAQYKVIVEEVANPDKREVFIVTIMHDGTTSADATDVDFDDLHRLRLSSKKVDGLDYNVILTGTGALQKVELQVESTNATNVTTFRECLD